MKWLNLQEPNRLLKNIQSPVSVSPKRSHALPHKNHRDFSIDIFWNMFMSKTEKGRAINKKTNQQTNISRSSNYFFCRIKSRFSPRTPGALNLDVSTCYHCDLLSYPCPDPRTTYCTFSPPNYSSFSTWVIDVSFLGLSCQLFLFVSLHRTLPYLYNKFLSISSLFW